LRTHSFDCSDPLHCPYSLKCRFISHLSDRDFVSCSGFYRRSVDVLDVSPPVDGNLSYYVEPALDIQPSCSVEQFVPVSDPVLDGQVVLSCPIEDVFEPENHLVDVTPIALRDKQYSAVPWDYDCPLPYDSSSQSQVDEEDSIFPVALWFDVPVVTHSYCGPFFEDVDHSVPFEPGGS